MIIPNWDVFKAKFNQNPQRNFEWFCYILFCKEFKKRTGIFRYKNQSAIETNPITIDGEVISWQAKFYDTTLSQHKKTLISAVEDSKNDYPDLTKLIFYTNQEWGQSHVSQNNNPKAKEDVEQIGRENNIEIEWRTASYFESPFVSVDNEMISEYFFSIDETVIDMIKSKTSHTENILEEIKTTIRFNGSHIEVSRENIIKDMVKKIKQQQVSIIAGDAGVGKTAVIKQFYSEYKEKYPIYIFKASEFEVSYINFLFGQFNLLDFVKAHEDEKEKIVIIDSAERLLDLTNGDSFKEFLTVLKNNNWTIIFTARSNYLTDLNMQFIDQYNIKPIKYYIEKISEEKLEKYANTYNFKLPKEEKMSKLLRNLFYLDEYLNLYSDDENINYQIFREKLWSKKIIKSSPGREQGFMNIALNRAKKGSFFVLPNLDQDILDELVQDGILNYETAGYFITHDIYEEWALEKIIYSEFENSYSYSEFLDNIGENLPIRRSFRKWLSEKLYLKDTSIENFIEEVLEDKSISTFWKDEILVSVLHSDYSDHFFEFFDSNLKANKYKLLNKIIFLLRVACKEVDEKNLELIQSDEYSIAFLKYIFAKPKGNGWKSTINFIFKNRNEFSEENLNIILPVLVEWNSNFKTGETTKMAAKLALKWYKNIEESDNRIYIDKKRKEDLRKIIIHGSAEIEEKLIVIFDNIIKNNWKNYRDPYYGLMSSILEEPMNNMEIITLFPQKVLEVAGLYWKKLEKPDETIKYSYNGGRISLEENFGMDGRNSHSYSPSSALQTPIYWLLQYSPVETINFILRFVNNSVNYYVESGIDEGGIENIYLKIGSNEVNQYGSSRLWHAYRGPSVTPNLFESIHMALEKYLLEIAPKIKENVLNSLLLQLLKKSDSVSITSIVSSVVIANYEKTFNVAQVLFRNKLLFFYDSERMTFDKTSGNLFFGINQLDKIYEEERSKSDNKEHREKSLERIAFLYQFFRSEEVSEEEANRRQEIIWNIFDDYYLEIESNDYTNNQTWQLFLARMDRRKMKPTIKEVDKGVEINFKPQISKELDEYSTTALTETNEKMEYISLHLWAVSKLKEYTNNGEYPQYEGNPARIIKEVKEVVEILRTDSQNIFNGHRSIPGMACTILIGEYFDNLTGDEREFCKDIILSYATASLRKNYGYQISDGVESAISILPTILETFPKERETVKFILCTILFDPNRIGAYAKFSDFSTNAISQKLWAISYEDAQSILTTFLRFKPKFNNMIKRMREENNSLNQSILPYNELMDKFIEENKSEIEKSITMPLENKSYGHLKEQDIHDLGIIFKMLPVKIKNKQNKSVALKIIEILSRNLLFSEQNRTDYLTDEQDFYKKFTKLVLSSDEDEVHGYLEPVLNNFKITKNISDLFEHFILAVGGLESYSNFWIVWESFYDKITEMNKSNHYVDDIIKSFLFASTRWNKGITEWGPLTKEKRRFFKKVSKNLGEHPSVLYSLALLLNGIGQLYLSDGINWISNIITKNENLQNVPLIQDTIYQLEKMMQMYIYENREKIKRTRKLKHEVLVILDFLIFKGSVAGYMLRENIL